MDNVTSQRDYDIPRIMNRRILLPRISSEIKPVCGICPIRELCLAAGLSNQEVMLLDQYMGHRQIVKKAESAYRMGDPSKSLFVVSTGFFRTSTLHENGHAQVTGFHMAGEILGLEAISTDKHISDAVALEDSTVCKITFDNLEKLAQAMPNLQHLFNMILSHEIMRGKELLRLLSMSSEERVATFLVNLSERFSVRKQSGSCLSLRMKREDIGSYLGLKQETVSRILSLFHDRNLLEVKWRSIRILDQVRLKMLAEGF